MGQWIITLMLDQPVPNPLAKNPNFNTHKVFAAIGIILMVLIIVVGGIWYMVQSAEDKVGTTEETTTKVATSSTKPKTATFSSIPSDWKIYVNNKKGYAIGYPLEAKIDIVGQNVVNIYLGEKLNVSGIADPYTIVLGIYERSGNNAKESCNNELCRNLLHGGNDKIEEFELNGSDAVKITNPNNPLGGDYYIGTKDGHKIVRIMYGTYKYEADNRTDQKRIEDFKLLEKIILTFKFL